MINFIGIAPYSPAIISEINKKKSLLIKRTELGMEIFSKELIKSSPDTIIFISPKGPIRYDKFTINIEKKIHGSFEKFGFLRSQKYSFTNDYFLAKKILKELRTYDFPIEPVQEEKIDYGTLVPLYYLGNKFKKKPKIINLNFCNLSWKTHFKLGQLLKEILSNEEENIALISCGDLSQRISEDFSGEYSPYGIKFDKTLLELLKNGDYQKILKLNPDFCSEAGELGLRSIIIALGLLDEKRTKFYQISYEAPLGNGYLIGRWRKK